MGKQHFGSGVFEVRPGACACSRKKFFAELFFEKILPCIHSSVLVHLRFQALPGQIRKTCKSVNCRRKGVNSWPTAFVNTISSRLQRAIANPEISRTGFFRFPKYKGFSQATAPVVPSFSGRDSRVGATGVRGGRKRWHVAKSGQDQFDQSLRSIAAARAGLRLNAASFGTHEHQSLETDQRRRLPFRSWDGGGSGASASGTRPSSAKPDRGRVCAGHSFSRYHATAFYILRTTRTNVSVSRAI